MFDTLARQAEVISKQVDLQSLGKNKKFTITKKEFDDFYKYHLFDQLKGEISLGQAFCNKFGTRNYVLETLPDASAKRHIETFYIK